MLCITFIITCVIPDIPSWLATEMAKIEWARREASRLSNTTTPSPEDVSIKLIGRFSVSPSHSLVTGTSDKKVEEKLKEAEAEVMKELLSSTSTPSPTPSLSEKNKNSEKRNHKPISITPDSIQPIPPFKPRKSKEWVHPDSNEVSTVLHGIIFLEAFHLIKYSK